MHLYTKVKLLLLILLIVGCEDRKLHFELTNDETFEKTLETLFVLKELNIDYELSVQENLSSVYVDHANANHANYVLSRLETNKVKVFSESVDGGDIVDIGLMEGVLNFRYNEVGNAANFTIVIERNTDKGQLEKQIKKMLKSSDFKSVNFSFIEFDLVQQINRYSYEFLSQVKNDKD